MLRGSDQLPSGLKRTKSACSLQQRRRSHPQRREVSPGRYAVAPLQLQTRAGTDSGSTIRVAPVVKASHAGPSTSRGPASRPDCIFGSSRTPEGGTFAGLRTTAGVCINRGRPLSATHTEDGA